MSCCGHPLQRPLLRGKLLGVRATFAGCCGPTSSGPPRADVTPQNGASPDASPLTRKRDFTPRRNAPFNMSTGCGTCANSRGSPGNRLYGEGMLQTCYTVEQFQRQWVVSVGGNRVLTPATPSASSCTARSAMVLLHRSERAQFRGDEAVSVGSDEPTDRVETVFRRPQDDSCRAPGGTPRS